jgi:hypothetical protein
MCQSYLHSYVTCHSNVVHGGHYIHCILESDWKANFLLNISCNKLAAYISGFHLKFRYASVFCCSGEFPGTSLAVDKLDVLYKGSDSGNHCWVTG